MASDCSEGPREGRWNRPSAITSPSSCPDLHPDRTWVVGTRGDHHPVRPVRAPEQGGRAGPRAILELRITVGMDYLIKPDVTVALGKVETASGLPPLHAAISCKWTIRSRPGAEHPPRVPADDPPPPRQAARTW